MPKGFNPVLKGFHPDPSILRVGSDYYIATSTFQWFGGVQLYHSKDLVHWEELPSPLRRISQLDLRNIPNSGGVWAPCLSYNNGTYYLIFTNVKNFHGIFKDTPNFLITTTDLYGEWSAPIFLNSSGFDPSLFHDDDGKKYLINMRWDSRLENHPFEGIILQEYSQTQQKLVGQPINIYKGTNIGCTEGPHLFKKDGYYYLIIAEGGTGYNHGVRLARSRNLYGPYESDSLPLITTRDNPEFPLQRVGHASYVQTQDGNCYLAFLCSRPISRHSILGRETGITEVIWTEDGWLRLKDGGVTPPLVYQSNLPEFIYGEQPDFVKFDTPYLPKEFKTLRLPFELMGSLTDNPGVLRLYGHESITSLNNQSLVARRLDCFNSETTIKMQYKPTTFQQMAGLTVFYDTFNFFYLFMSVTNENENELRILVRDNLKFYNPIKNSVNIKNNTSVWLRVVVSELSLQFYYSLNGNDFNPIGPSLDCKNLSDEAYHEIEHEGHTGTFIGMACQDLTGNNLYADFEEFNYRRL